MVLRFLMGVFEASTGPCWVALMSMYYKKEEQGLRVTYVKSHLSLYTPLMFHANKVLRGPGFGMASSVWLPL